MRSLVCPECAAAVPLPSGLGIPAAGRLVSCGRCSTIWRVLPHEAPAEPPPRPTPATEPTGAATSKTAATRRRGRGRKLALAVILGIGVTGSLAGLAFLARHHLAVWMPASRAIFLAAGASVKPSGIEAGIVGWRPGGDGSLLIGYRVANPTAMSQPMPEICVEGRGEDGETSFRRCFAPDIDKLPPDTARNAEFRVLDIHGAVRVVELRTAPPSR